MGLYMRWGGDGHVSQSFLCASAQRQPVKLAVSQLLAGKKNPGDVEPT